MSQEKSFTAYFDAIKSHLVQSSNKIKDSAVTVFDVTEGEQVFSGPTILVEFSDFDRPVKTSGKKSVELRMHIHCILSAANDNVSLEVANFAAFVSTLIDSNTWGLDYVKPPTEISGQPGKFDTGTKGFDSWIVSFKQVVGIGDGWEPDNFVPDQVLWGLAPDVGLGNEDNYKSME